MHVAVGAACSSLLWMPCRDLCGPWTWLDVRRDVNSVLFNEWCLGTKCVRVCSWAGLTLMTSQKIGYVMTEAECREMMVFIDTDHSGTIELDEFL